MLIITSIIAAASAQANSPSVTYLTCTFPKTKYVLLVAADQANGAVTLTSEQSGYVQRLPAAFAAEKVTFHNSVLNYEISRVDLTIRRSVDQMNDPEIGTCAVQEPPKRAF